MSIINEALKKTQEKLKIRTALQDAQAGSQTDKSLLPWITTTLILGCFLGSILIYFVFIQGKGRPLMVSKTIPNVEPPLKTGPPPASSPATANVEQTKLPPVALSQPRDNLVVNGIVTMGNDRYVLINNEIYRTGDFIEDKQIINIFEDKVEILDGGNILTLSTKSK